jgi:RimJ/RimL family protein N-acetyltransferase
MPGSADRIEVRPYEAADVDELVAAVRESLAELGPWMPWAHAGYGPDHARTWIDATIAGRASRSLFDFAVLVDGRFAGACGVNQISWATRVANLGYWVRTSATGQGVAPEAVRRVVAWTFANTDLNRLEIVVACDNARSLRVAEKVGAERDAVLRKRLVVDGRAADAVLHAVIRPD